MGKRVAKRRQMKMIQSWIDVGSLRRSQKGSAKLLFDEVTNLPTVPLLFDEIRNILKDRGQMGLLYISIVQYSMIEYIYGWKTFDTIVKEIARGLIDVKENYLRKQDYLGEVTINGNALVLLLSPPRTKEWIDYDDLKGLRERVYEKLHGYLREHLDFNLYQKFGCYIGCAIMEEDSTARFERNIYRVLEEAYADCVLEKERDSRRRAKILKDIVRKKMIRTLYHPIVDLHEKEIIGYEALSRGPAGEFENPDYLFRIAAEADAIWRLERLCRSQAFKGACELQDGKLLFINVDPDAIYDPKFCSSETLTQIAESRLSPERVVIELTEHTAVMDFPAFRHTLQLYKALGFKVAIDDVGSGYSSLQSIAELRPDFIKMDMSLTRGVHDAPIKQELTSTIARFSQNIGMKMIVEGVETEAELKTLQKLGVRFAQGFYFAFPGNPFPEVDPAKLGRSHLNLGL